MFDYIEGMTQFDYEYVVDVPKLGFVGCDDRDSAIAFAVAVNGVAYMQIWANGNVIETIKLADIS